MQLGSHTTFGRENSEARRNSDSSKPDTVGWLIRHRGRKGEPHCSSLKGWKIVHFHQGNSNGVVHTAHDRGVVPRWQVCNDRTFPRVSGSVTTVLNSASLVAGNDSAYNAGLPVIITRNQGSGAVVQFQGRISQCIGNRVLSELRTNGTNNDCLRSAPFNNEAANHHVVAGLN